MPHALLSPSGASRWMACTPSARLEESFKDSGSSYAAEGTLAHELAEVLCRHMDKQISVDEMVSRVDEIGKSEYFDADMWEYLTAYVGYVQECLTEARAATPDAILDIESRLDLHEWIPDGFGTADVVIVSDGLLHVVDLKYGKGVPVTADNNMQLMIYGLGALDKYDYLFDLHTVRLTIYQPRLDVISTWEISAADLRQWAETELKEKARLAFEGSGAYAADDHCRFCKAKASCRARAEENLRLARYDFKDGPLLTNVEIADILRVAENLKDWADDVSAYALQQALSGEKYDGFKLVEGRSNRTFTDEAAAKTVLESIYSPEHIYTTKLKGITDLEKLMGKKTFTEILGKFVVKPTGKPTLVSVMDKRPEWTNNSSAIADFQDISA